MQTQHLEIGPVTAMRSAQATGMHDIHGLLPSVLPCTFNFQGNGFVVKQPFLGLLHEGVDAE